jgi:hypothetical protein
MSIEPVATISFIDRDSGSPAVAIVRRCGTAIGLAISIERNGDIEVFLDANAAAQVRDAISTGINMIRSAKS